MPFAVHYRAHRLRGRGLFRSAYRAALICAGGWVATELRREARR